ncbi:uncharacterized protein ACLA_089830 [Aspergillus clavatus NRRL 1]|uniref:Uncharacterized protein n=1 Tax=Aspergillus clavatus (strain ATCC 1007 / CBS 513.65 / DSM 816 / NCTC 3887 / NRRL 1 / QM 1276 / 107) TaxID=344612 RepID=A1CEJ2_ASPCL|nr:uncharacterized protein ACLA_089830 [Aspergillus clavatus NRRL 1]EAW11291.1 hypothetical protein ACLA_089830 [Aspergillus clavatus NRRL 1]
MDFLYHSYASGAVTLGTFVVMRETSAVAILKSKAARLRKESGNPNLRAAGDRQTPIKDLVAHALTRPIKFLALSLIVILIPLYIAFNFGVTMLLFATFPTVFENTYHWSIGISGLAYVGMGVGCAIGVVTFSKLSDRLLRTEGGEYRAERRLILMIAGSSILRRKHIIDIFGPHAAASALTAVTLLRNLLGAFLPIAAPSLYAHLNLG